MFQQHGVQLVHILADTTYVIWSDLGLKIDLGTFKQWHTNYVFLYSPEWVCWSLPLNLGARMQITWSSTSPTWLGIVEYRSCRLVLHGNRPFIPIFPGHPRCPSKLTPFACISPIYLSPTFYLCMCPMLFQILYCSCLDHFLWQLILYCHHTLEKRLWVHTLLCSSKIYGTHLSLQCSKEKSPSLANLSLWIRQLSNGNILVNLCCIFSSLMLSFL